VDTRAKIIERAAAERIAGGGARLTVVTGYFDPLTAAHAARLAQIAATAETLLVVVRTPERPLLPARARAELVAALSAVNHVVVEEGDPAWIAELPSAHLVREEVADARRTQDLVARVHQRQAAG
jgi:bifunctional ADP-heptose synthase (sugar kinase/adenylyltransferase)